MVIFCPPGSGIWIGTLTVSKLETASAMKPLTRPPMPLRIKPIAGLKNAMDAGPRALQTALVTLEGTPLREQLETCRSDVALVTAKLILWEPMSTPRLHENFMSPSNFWLALFLTGIHGGTFGHPNGSGHLGSKSNSPPAAKRLFGWLMLRWAPSPPAPAGEIARLPISSSFMPRSLVHLPMGPRFNFWWKCKSPPWRNSCLSAGELKMPVMNRVITELLKANSAPVRVASAPSPVPQRRVGD